METHISTGEPVVLTWRIWRSLFWFLLLSSRAGKLKIQITDFGMERLK